MKKHLPILLLFGLLFASCGERHYAGMKEPTIHIEQYFSAFAKDNPGMLDNNLKFEKASESFAMSLADTLGKSNYILEDYPFQFVSLQETKNGLVAYFTSYAKPYNLSFARDSINEVYGDIVGIVPDKYIDILKEKEFYIIHGKLQKFLSIDEFETYTNNGPITLNIGMKKDEVMEGKVDIELGMMLYQVDSISAFGE